MSRQDANAAFALSSFLYGGNAAYMDDLYARYETDPNAVDAQWQVFFRSLKDDRAAVLKNARGPSWSAAELAAAAARRSHHRAGGRLGRGRARGRRQAQGQGAEPRRRNLRRRGAAGHPRFDPCPDADPRLPHPRRLPRQSRSARARAAEGPLRARSALLRLQREPTTTGRSFSTACSVSNSAPSARSSPSCSAPTARPWRSSSCTSPTAPRRAGCRSASRAPTRRSASPAKASAPSSTS